MTLVFREVALAFKRAPLLAMLGVTTIAFSLFAFWCQFVGTQLKVREIISPWA